MYSRHGAVVALGCALGLAQLSHGELFIHPLPCPSTIPPEACFGTTASQQVDWATHSGDLALTPTVEYVQNLLQVTLEVEHSVIPLYLSTYYSIIDQTSFEAVTMRGVVMEEMLHMVSAANAINAIGGAPFLDHPDFIPKYPLVLPELNMSADIVWFTQSSMSHYQVLESTPPGGYETSISAAYLHIVNVLTALCKEHNESSVFTGNHSLQVNATISSGQGANAIYTLADLRAALLGVADQGGGCPIPGLLWPLNSSIEAGPLGGAGGNFSHSARYEEILLGREYLPHDKEGFPTGPNHTIDWTNVRRFAPNPSISDFLPAQCVSGGSWVVRNESFFVRSVWDQHAHHLAVSNETSWEDCAKKCEAWTIDFNRPLEPCAMWTWRNASAVTLDGGKVPAHSCLLAQGGGPVTGKTEGFMSGCQFGTVCNQSLPVNDNFTVTPPKTDPSLLAQCAVLHQRGVDFASNYTAMLVDLHDVFNGNPQGIYATVGIMYTLKTLAVNLMETADPRIEANTMGVGPPWEYIPAASKYEARGRAARPGSRPRKV